MNGSLVDVLECWAVDVFTTVGLRSEDAAQVAASLAFAERRGVTSHGFIRMGIYADRMVSGGINVRSRLTVLSDRGALVVLDADDGPGAVTGRAATELAVARTRRHGIGCVITRNASHFGAAGYFANLIADEGMVGVVACNTDMIMCPPFGGRPVLGSNPLAVAIPSPAQSRPQLDMATTQTSLGKVLLARQNATSLPPGWAVGPDGDPTTSPIDALDGALLPAAGPKGFGLAFMIDALVAIGGAMCSPDVGPMYGDPSLPQRLGQLFLALDVGDERTRKIYDAQIKRLVDTVHGSGSPTVRPPLFPGEPEVMYAATAVKELRPELREELALVGERFGVPLPT